MGQTPKTETQLCRVGRPPKVATPFEVASARLKEDIERDILKPIKAQAYALRIWSGQSVDLPRAERVRRVTAGVEAQGMSMDGVILPEIV